MPHSQAGTLAFFKNAKPVRTVQLTREHMAQELYASVGIASPGGVVRAVHMSGAAAAGMIENSFKTRQWNKKQV